MRRGSVAGELRLKPSFFALLAAASACFAALAQIAPGAAAPDAPKPVPMRAESRAGFGRVAFDFPSRVRFSVNRDGDRLLITFTDPRAIGSPEALPRNVRAATGGAGRAEIVVAAGAQIRPGRIDNRIVIDILDPTPSAESPPPPPAPAAEAPPAAPAPPPSSPSEAKTQPPEPSPPVPKPEPAPARESAGGPVSLSVRRVEPPPGSAWAFFVPFEATVGAASFQAADAAVIVFDERRPLDLAPLRGSPELGGVSVQLLPAATVIRVPASAGPAFAAQRQPEGWVIAAAPAKPGPKPIRMEAAAGRLTLRAEVPGKVVTVIHPDTGANILIGTLRQAGEGIAATRRTAEFALLPTGLGIAVDPLSDRLIMTAVPEGFALSAFPDGLAMVPQPEGAGELAASETLTRRFDFPPLSERELATRLQAQISEAGSAPPLARGPKRRAAAETMIALGLGPEAQALLQLASLDDAREAENPSTQGLLAIAALLAGRPEDAEALADPRLTGADEITLWRAVRAAMADEKSAAAASSFAATARLVLAYPQPLRVRLLPLAAETLATAGDPRTSRAPNRQFSGRVPARFGKSHAARGAA